VPLIHFIDLLAGEKIKIQQLKDLATSDPKLQDLMEELREKLMQKLHHNRDKEMASSQPSNCGAAIDVRCMVKHIGEKVRILHK